MVGGGGGYKLSALKNGILYSPMYTRLRFVLFNGGSGEDFFSFKHLSLKFPNLKE